MSYKSMRSDVRAYLACALWSSTLSTGGEGATFTYEGTEYKEGTPFDDIFSVDDLSDEIVAQAEADLDAFWEAIPQGGGALAAALDAEAEQVAHDFWLSRNGHGTGFFDGDYGEHRDGLQALARTFGTVDLYVGDDGKIYA